VTAFYGLIPVPLKTINSSGYGYESGSDKGSDDEPPPSFSPVSFSDSAVHEQAVPGIKKPAASGGKSRACADADILRQHGTRTIEGAGAGGCVDSVMNASGADQSGEKEEEEKVWCVVEKEDNVIRARICSDTDITEAGGLSLGKEGEEWGGASGIPKKLKDGDDELVLCDASKDAVKEGRGESDACDHRDVEVRNETLEQGFSSEAIPPREVTTSGDSVDSSLDPRDTSAVDFQSSAVKELLEEGSASKSQGSGESNTSVAEEVDRKSPEQHHGSDPFTESVGATDNDSRKEEVIAGVGRRENGAEGDKECSHSQENKDSPILTSTEKPDSQKEEHKRQEANSDNYELNARIPGEGYEQEASDDQLKRSSGVLISPTRESDRMRPIKRSGQVLTSPTREVDSVRPIKRSSEVLTSPDREKWGTDSRSPDLHLSPTRYYATTDVPEVGGVMVDLLDETQTAGGSREEAEKRFLLSVSQQARTHGEASSQVRVDECKSIFTSYKTNQSLHSLSYSTVPESLSRGSPMENPFLGQQNSPSWSRHERARSKDRELQRQQEENPTFTLAIISRRSCRRAGRRSGRSITSVDAYPYQSSRTTAIY